MKIRLSWFGVALIVIGAALILERLQVLRFTWSEVFWAVLVLVSAIKIVQGFSNSMTTQGRRGRGRVFWWTVIGSYSTYQVLRVIGWYDPPDNILFALMMIAIGGGITLMFLSYPRDWHVAIPAVIVLGLGITIYLGEIGTLYRWDIMHVVATYWPVALILFGAGMLLNRREEIKN